MKLLLWAEVGLLERKSDLNFFDYSAAHCWTVPRVPFLPGFSWGKLLFSSLVSRVQTKRGILDQVHVPMAFVFHGDLPKNLCQREELTANQHCCLMLGLQATGQRTTSCSSHLCSASHKCTQDTCTSGQTHIVEYTNTSAQWGLSYMLMPGLEWVDVHFGFNCVVLCISLGLIMGLYRVWVGEDACMKQRQRAFSGQMRRWRASSAWALLLYLIWSGAGLLLEHHSGWSLPVLTSVILKNGYC